MAGGYETPPVGDFAVLRAGLKEVQRRLDVLERPTGTQTAEALRTLTELVEGLLEQTSLAVTNNITAGGTITAGGSITTTGGYIFTPLGYAFDITYTRRGAWLGNDGRLGYASSSAEKKANIRDAEIDPEAVLAIAPRLFNYRAELAKQAEDPSYHVATEFGAIAEELHELGLWQVVIYEWDVLQRMEPVLDDAGSVAVDGQGDPVLQPVGEAERVGEPRPVGIHYEMLGLLAIEAAKHVHDRLNAVEGRLAAAGL